MIRADNWPEILARFIDERRAIPFAWGHNDCCLFAADWIRAACGMDLAEDVRGQYSTALGAARLLKRYGGVRGLIRQRGDILGMRSIDSRAVQRGDLVVADTGNGESIGISLGNVAAFVARDGLIFAPFDFQLRAPCWRF